MRLQASGIRALHLLPHAGDAGGIHHLVSQSALFEKVLQVGPIDSIGDDLRSSGAYFGAFAVRNCLN